MQFVDYCNFKEFLLYLSYSLSFSLSSHSISFILPYFLSHPLYLCVIWLFLKNACIDSLVVVSESSDSFHHMVHNLWRVFAPNVCICVSEREWDALNIITFWSSISCSCKWKNIANTTNKLYWTWCICLLCSAYSRWDKETCRNREKQCRRGRGDFSLGCCELFLFSYIRSYIVVNVIFLCNLSSVCHTDSNFSDILFSLSFIYLPYIRRHDGDHFVYINSHTQSKSLSLSLLFFPSTARHLSCMHKRSGKKR